MLKNRSKLEEELIDIMQKNKNDNDFHEKIINDLKERISKYKLNSILTFKIPLKIILVEELYLLTKAMYNNFKGKEIDPDIWFTVNEKIKADNFYLEEVEEQNDGEKLLSLNVVQVGDKDEWVSVVSYDQIYDFMKKGLLLYNPDTQREGVVEEIAGNEIILPKIYQKSVNEIARKIKEDKFFANTITFNILKTGEERFSYDKETKILDIVIDDYSHVDIIDGMHRIMGIVKAKADNPNLKGEMIVHIFNMNVTKAQSYIFQEQIRNKMSSEIIRKFNSEDKFTQVAKGINEYENETLNSMYNKITIHEKELEGNKYCLMSTLSDAIKDNFQDIITNDSSVRDLNKIIRYLVDFFNEFTGIYDKDFKDLETTKEILVTANNNTFVGLVALARKLYQENCWESILENSLRKVNWSKGNPVWKDIRLFSKVLNKQAKEKLYGYFKNLYQKDGRVTLINETTQI